VRMRMDNGRQHSWWATLPGVLTGVAAVLSAVSGLVLAINQLDLFSAAPSSEVEATVEAPPAGAEVAAKVPPPLAGRTFKVDGNDGIVVRQVPIGSDSVEFALEVAPAITWWKGLKIYDRQGDMISLLATQDGDKGPKSSGPLTSARFGPQIEIEFLKAKAFGAHTGVGRMPFSLADVRGFRTIFYWESD
jgi:hypothetical protein